MLVKEIMTGSVTMIPPTATLQEAASIMQSKDIGVLPISDGEFLSGMITDRDIAVRGAAEGDDPRTTKVRDIMTPQVIFCNDGDNITEAARIMEEHHLHRLLVLNTDKTVVGMVSLSDIALQAHDERLTGEVLREVSKH